MHKCLNITSQNFNIGALVRKVFPSGKALFFPNVAVENEEIALLWLWINV